MAARAVKINEQAVDSAAGEAAATETRRLASREARGLLAEASIKVGDEAITDIVLPTIERVMHGHGDLHIADHEGFEGKGLVRVLRTETALIQGLRKAGIEDELIATALRFANDFERCRIGNLTANYEGVGSGKRDTAAFERWLDKVRQLAAACQALDQDERVVVFGCIIYDIGNADLGAYVASGMTADKNMWVGINKYILNKALIKLMKFYEHDEFVRERRQLYGF